MNKVKLKDIASIIMGQSPNANDVFLTKIGLPLLNGPAEFTTKYPIPVQYTTDAKRVAVTNDILFCVRGSTTGRMNIADQEYAIGRGLAAIRHKEDTALNTYIKALLEINLKKLLGGTLGSVFPNLTKDNIIDLECYIHNKQLQYSIASVLSSLDAKIELNNRINAELEAMAKTLYDYWFVQFEFPSPPTEGCPQDGVGSPPTEGCPQDGVGSPPSVGCPQDKVGSPLTDDNSRDNVGSPPLEGWLKAGVVSPPTEGWLKAGVGYKSSGGKMVWNNQLKREIPVGWKAGVIGDYCSSIGGFAFKSEWWNNEGVSIVKIKDIQENFTINLSDLSKVDLTDKKVDDRFKAKAGDILIAMTGATIGKYAIVPMTDYQIYVNQRVGYFNLGSDPTEKLPFLINSLNQKYFREAIYSLASGAAQPNISNEQINSIPLVLPETYIIQSFNRHLKSTYQKILVNQFENQRLSSLRDWLLPMLMNGQISLGAAEKAIYRVEEELSLAAEPE